MVITIINQDRNFKEHVTLFYNDAKDFLYHLVGKSLNWQNAVPFKKFNRKGFT